MDIKRNQTSYTVTPTQTETLLVYSPPYITDGTVVVNLDADRNTLKLTGVWKPLVGDRIKEKTPFRADLRDEGHVLTDLDTPPNLGAAFRSAEGVDAQAVKPAELTSVAFLSEDPEKDAVIAADVPGAVGVYSRYASLWEHNKAFRPEGDRAPFIIFRAFQRKPWQPLAVVVAVPLPQETDLQREIAALLATEREDNEPFGQDA